MRQLFLLLTTLLSFSALAQRQRVWERERSNDGAILLVHFKYGVDLPGADLADRFDVNSSLGGVLELQTGQNLLLGIETKFLYGNKVDDDVLGTLRNEDGLIFSDDFVPADVRLRERGLYLGGHVGKVFPLGQGNRRSGVRATIGAGFLRHKIKIQDDPFVFISLLGGDYKKGFDKLSNGLALNQFVGYQLLSKSRLLDFLVGLEFTQGFTESRRSYDFDLKRKETGKRLDLLFGLRIGWTLPFYIGEDAGAIQY